MSDHKIILLYSLYPDDAAAQEAAAMVIDGKLAACANRGASLLSLYPWQGEMKSATEIPIIFKTLPHKVAELIERLKQNHPYETPCFLDWQVTASAEYYEWLRSYIEG